MAVSTSYLDALDNLLANVEGLGRKFTGAITGASAALTTTDPDINRATETQLRNKFLYWPDAGNAEDVIHSVAYASVSGATTTITTRGAYTGTDASATLYVLAVNPDDLRAILNGLLEDGTLTQRVLIPLGSGPSDYNNLASGVSAYTATTATLTKDTSEVIEGLQSLKVLLTSASGKAVSGTFRAGSSRSGLAAFLVRADVGSFSLKAVDASETELAALTADEEEWVLALKRFTLASDDELVGVSLVGTSNNDVLYSQWNVLRMEYSGRFELPSWIQQRHEVKAVLEVVPGAPARNAGTYYWDSCTQKALQKDDYRVPVRYGDVLSGRITLTERARRAHAGHLLLLEAEVPYNRAYGATGDVFSTYSDTVACPIDQLVAAWMNGLAKARPAAFGDIRRDAGEEEAEQLNAQEQEEAEQRPRSNFGWHRAL